MGERDRQGKFLRAERVGAGNPKLMSILSATLQPGFYWFIHSLITCEQDRKAYSIVGRSDEKQVNK